MSVIEDSCPSKHIVATMEVRDMRIQVNEGTGKFDGLANLVKSLVQMDLFQRSGCIQKPV